MCLKNLRNLGHESVDSQWDLAALFLTGELFYFNVNIKYIA